jgi:hypothetical protein
MQQVGDTTDVPETLHGIVAARIDGLPPTEKSLLHAAAVLGKVFWTDALAALAEIESGQLDDMLYALERKEFVRQERRSTVARQLASYTPRGATRRAGRCREPSGRACTGRPSDRDARPTAPMTARRCLHTTVTALDYARTAGIDAEDRPPAPPRPSGKRATARLRSTLPLLCTERASALDSTSSIHDACRHGALPITEFRGEDEAAAEAALRRAT